MFSRMAAWEEAAAVLRALKSGAPGIPFFAEGREAGSLRPLTNGATDREIGLLVDWRNRNRDRFLTWIDSTPASARRWLDEAILARHDRLLFLVETPEGEPFGQVGLTNFEAEERACELDNWIRGPGAGVRGGMTMAIRALMDFCFRTLGAQRVRARVFADNPHVVDLHRGNGLRVMRTMPLRRIDRDGSVTWSEEEGLAGAEKSLVHLEASRDGYAPLNHPADYLWSASSVQSSIGRTTPGKGPA